MDSFAHHMFGPATKAAQEAAGTRAKYEAVYETRLTEGLDADARAFIETRTSFYIASIVESGYPYIQHRGGPAGFLKVLENDTLGFIDYRGNKQFITQGSLTSNDRVSLILMDYPRKARLKLIGRAKMIAAKDDPALTERLMIAGQGPAERIMTIQITAQDWNCPQYITPRFTEEEIATMLGPRLTAMESQITRLAARLTELGEDPSTLLAPQPDPS
jgi:predicted pyridoxine 5'-phosphate oxidase superfamily flavin-nucleotide-binding protein